MTDRLVMVFLIDALGFEQAGAPGFLSVLDRPRSPVRSVLGYSSAALPTLLSGLYPEEHGMLSMYRRGGSDGVFKQLDWWLRPLASMTKRQWTLRRWAARAVEQSGVTGYFSLYDVPLSLLSSFDLCQRKDIFAPGAFGRHRGLADLMPRDARIWSWRVREADALAELGTELDRGTARFLFLYSAELDSTMHSHGPRSEATSALLARYDRVLTDLIEKAKRRYREVRVFAFGDHGMAAVTGTHDLWTPLRRLGLAVPRELLFFLDSTMARFWYGTKEARRKVEALLQSLDYGRVIPEDELRALRADFPRAEYGQSIFLLKEGEILVPSYMSSGPVQGMHGYHPDDPSMYTTLLTNAEVECPADLVGIHRILRAEIEALGNAA